MISFTTQSMYIYKSARGLILTPDWTVIRTTQSLRFWGTIAPANYPSETRVSFVKRGLAIQQSRTTIFSLKQSSVTRNRDWGKRTPPFGTMTSMRQSISSQEKAASLSKAQFPSMTESREMAQKSSQDSTKSSIAGGQISTLKINRKLKE